MRDFLLLFMIRLHLVHLVLALRPHIRRVITRVVHKLLLLRQIHDVGAHAVHEVLRVGGDDEDVVVRREVGFKPHNGSQVQVVSGFV